MTKKELIFIISITIVSILINIIWILIDMETYVFIGIMMALVPTIGVIKLTKDSIKVFKTNKEI